MNEQPRVVDLAAYREERRIEEERVRESREHCRRLCSLGLSDEVLASVLVSWAASRPPA